eukprot:m.329575 g.329575  ORF g.329575 m.329575 type:complete len:622 (-) comp27711_c0_seq5:186-2051(-)
MMPSTLHTTFFGVVALMFACLVFLQVWITPVSNNNGPNHGTEWTSMHEVRTSRQDTVAAQATLAPVAAQATRVAHRGGADETTLTPITITAQATRGADPATETKASFQQPNIRGVSLATAPKVLAAVVEANARALADLDAGRPLRVPTTPRFCALLATTAKPQYADDLVLIAKTLFNAPNVHTFLMFNLHSKSDPPRSVSEQLCAKLRGIGSNFECVWVPSHCRHAKCVASVFFRSMHQVGSTVVDKCDWVVKVDPDVIFVPRAAARFVQGLSPELPALFGGGSGTTIWFNNNNTATPGVARRQRGKPDPWPENRYHCHIGMPQGHWMASISTWRAMMMPELTGNQCKPPRMVVGVKPSLEYLTVDEAAVALCAWTTRAANCLTYMPYPFSRTGPAGGLDGVDKFASPLTLRHIEKVRKAGKFECLMFIHVWPRDEYIATFQKLSSLNHSDRECGSEGIDLVGKTTQLIVMRYGRSMPLHYKDGLAKRFPPDPQEQSCTGRVDLLRHPLRGVAAHDVSDTLADAMATVPWLKPGDTEGVCQCMANLNDIQQPNSWGTARNSTKMSWKAFECSNLIPMNRSEVPNSTMCQCLAEVPKSERKVALNESRRLSCPNTKSRTPAQ